MKNWIRRTVKISGWLIATGVTVLLLASPWLASRYIVRCERGWVVVPKRYLAMCGTCVDVRGWDWKAFEARPELREALVRAGYAELVPPRPRAAASDRLAENWEALRGNIGTAWRDFQRDSTDRFADWIAEADRRWFGE